MKILLHAIQIMFVALLASCSGETITNSFTNYSEMQSSGIFEKGWLPSYLPKSATNIKETHNLDSNTVNATFDFNTSDVESIKENCKLLEETEKVYVFSCEVSGTSANVSLFKNGKAKYKSAPK